MATDDKLQKYWDKSSATVPYNKDPSNYAVEKVKLFPRNSVICDLGSGSGTDSLYFANQGHKVKLIDISDVALKRATKAAINQGLSKRIDIIPYNFDKGNIPLPEASCDVVYSRLALQYFEQDTTIKLFGEIYRILKPDGKAFLTLKSPEDVAEMQNLKHDSKAKSDGVYINNGFVKTRFTVEQLKQMLQAARIKQSDFYVGTYTEVLGGRKDRVKSGNTQLILNEIQIFKPSN